MTSAFSRIATTLHEVYGVGPLAASAEAALWAATKQPDPEACLSALNRERQKHGRPLVYAPYRHFATLSA